MLEVFLGIDLGTTTTLIARAIEGEQAISVRVLDIPQKSSNQEIDLSYLPSVAYFPLDKPPMIGLEAVRLGSQDPSRLVRAVKRHMGRRIILPFVKRAPYEISALYLEKALLEGKHQLPMEDMVFTVTVPASFTTNQRADTLLALQKACKEVKIPYPESDEGQLFISEPVAAMLAFLNEEFDRPIAVRKLDLSKVNRIVVYDIGGGTLDLTLVYIEPKKEPVQNLADLDINVDSISYYNPFGGEDFDFKLALELHRRWLESIPDLAEISLSPQERQGLRLDLMNIAKDTKEKLSEQMGGQSEIFFDEEDDEEITQRYSSEIRLQENEYHIEGEINAEEYRELVADLVENESRKSLLTPLKDLLNKTGFDPQRLDGLLIVGGMGKLSLIKESLSSFWGNDRVWLFNPPDQAVVGGAAIYSYLRRRYPGFSLREPAADAYYVRLETRFDLILPANAKNKRGEKKHYDLSVDSDRLLLQIFAGEEPTFNQTIEDIYPTLIAQGSTIIPLGKIYQKGTPVYVQMFYDSETEEDHTKVPWLNVWVGNDSGVPLVHKRYSKFIEEDRYEESI